MKTNNIFFNELIGNKAIERGTGNVFFCENSKQEKIISNLIVKKRNVRVTYDCDNNIISAEAPLQKHQQREFKVDTELVCAQFKTKAKFLSFLNEMASNDSVIFPKSTLYYLLSDNVTFKEDSTYFNYLIDYSIEVFKTQKEYKVSIDLIKSRYSTLKEFGEDLQLTPYEKSNLTKKNYVIIESDKVYLKIKDYLVEKN